MTFRTDLQAKLLELEIVTDSDINRNATTSKLVATYNDLTSNLTDEQKEKLTFDPVPLEAPKSNPPATKTTPKSKQKKSPSKKKAIAKTKECSFCRGTMELDSHGTTYVCTNCPHKEPVKISQ